MPGVSYSRANSNSSDEQHLATRAEHLRQAGRRQQGSHGFAMAISPRDGPAGEGTNAEITTMPRTGSRPPNRLPIGLRLASPKALAGRHRPEGGNWWSRAVAVG
jgi:hypothetical protein